MVAAPDRVGEPTRREFHVAVRLTDDEHAHLVFVAVVAGVSVGELLRAAYFDPHHPTEGTSRADHP